MSDFDEVAVRFDYGRTVQPGAQQAVDGAVAVVSQQGGGLGARNNDLSISTSDMGATVSSTLNWPRTAGRAWTENAQQRFAAAAGGIESQAAATIEQSF